MNSRLLSELVASTVLAGELSLMAAQVSGDLVKAHERLGHILLIVYLIIVCFIGTKSKVVCLLQTISILQEKSIEHKDLHCVHNSDMNVGLKIMELI